MAFLFSMTSNHIMIEDIFWLPIHSWYLTARLESWHRHPGKTSGFRGEKVWDRALDQCHGECQEMVITALEIYSLGQSKLLSLFSRFFLAVFNLFALFPLSAMLQADCGHTWDKGISWLSSCTFWQNSYRKSGLRYLPFQEILFPILHEHTSSHLKI